MDPVRAEVGGVELGPQFEQNLSGVASQQCVVGEAHRGGLGVLGEPAGDSPPQETVPIGGAPSSGTGSCL